MSGVSSDDERKAYTDLVASVTGLLGECRVVRHWSAHDHETPDGLPFVGEAPFAPSLFMAAGFAGWGMTKSVVASAIIAEAVEGRAHPAAMQSRHRVSPGSKRWGCSPGRTSPWGASSSKVT